MTVMLAKVVRFTHISITSVGHTIYFLHKVKRKSKIVLKTYSALALFLISRTAVPTPGGECLVI